MSDSRPIGVFDSGIGGLTVMKSLMAALPEESFLYLGDTARLPYGSKSAGTIERYLKQNIQFLVARDVKAIVVACNSASTVLLSGELQFSLPVYDVIRPGARAALAASIAKQIGVLGTKATVSAKAYVQALHEGDKTVKVYQQACPLLVPLVEEGWEDDPLTNLIIYRYVQPLIQSGIDTLILGCTHYPVLKDAIRKVTGPGIELVDSSLAILEDLRCDLANNRWQAAPSGAKQEVRLLTTDVSANFEEVARHLLKPHAFPGLEPVDLN